MNWPLFPLLLIVFVSVLGVWIVHSHGSHSQGCGQRHSTAQVAAAGFGAALVDMFYLMLLREDREKREREEEDCQNMRLEGVFIKRNPFFICVRKIGVTAVSTVRRYEVIYVCVALDTTKYEYRLLR